MASALKHVVFMQFGDGISAERVDEHKGAVLGLEPQISVLRNIEFGKDLSGRADGLTHCIIATFADAADRDAYLNDPVHVPVAEALVADLERLLVMDVEF